MIKLTIFLLVVYNFMQWQNVKMSYVVMVGLFQKGDIQILSCYFLQQ